MRRIIAIVVLIIALSQFVHAQERPNVLLVILDDFNDYTGVQGGHPQAYTPNIDAFLQQNIHFQMAAPGGVVCVPARAALFTGLTPVQTNIWDNTDMNEWDNLDVVTLPEIFGNEGYTTFNVGKTFHPSHVARDRVDVRVGGLPNPPVADNLSGYPLMDKDYDWADFPITDEMGDHRRVDAFGEFLIERSPDENWLAMVGLTATHKPLYCPAGYFPFSVEETEFPPILANDQDDIPETGRMDELARTPGLLAYGEDAQREVLHAYLNCVSYEDYEFGRVLDILMESDFADNTIIVLVADQGFHLGEKVYYGKHTLWKSNTRGLFGMSIPGMEPEAIADPVNSAAAMVTLAELAGIKAPESDYKSLVPLLEGKDWDGAGVTFKAGGYVALQYEQYKYIFTGPELVDVQVYDTLNDPNEWHNIADMHDPELIEEQRKTAQSILDGTHEPL